ncbi:27745_t:CDS:2, partial [Gigaspora margarita]
MNILGHMSERSFSTHIIWDWKRDANTTPITTPLKINLTFDPSLNQWSFPIQFGTPPQTMNIPIDMTYNLLWIVSELCISPFGDACNT